LSRLGQKLSAAISPRDAARVIGETARELFGWDSFTLNLLSAGDKMFRPILNIDTIDGKLVEVPESESGTEASPLARRIIKHGSELILKKAPLTMLSDSHPIGDLSRPSASLMYVPIRNRKAVIGVLSIQSYSLNAYNEGDLKALETIADHCGGALERIRAEEALRSSEVRFYSVWENSVDGMRLTDEQGIIVAVNKAFCKLVEMEREELVGQIFTVTYAKTENHEELLRKYKQRFKEHTVSKFIERRMTFRSGKNAELEGTNSFVDLEGARPLLLGLFRDVTEQKRLEAQLRQSQKMDSIGQLAGGIAHDFNNLLTVIQGHVSLLSGSAQDKKGEPTDSLQQIAVAAERSANLTRQLLTFSRRQVIQRRPLDLKEIVDEITKMLRRILGEDIVLTVENSSNLPRIHADRGMMEQILLNLAINSRDAMPRGGELIISTNAVRIDEAYTRRNSDAYLGEFVCLKVSDTGSGIAPENLVHIFEPFFTTKEIGKGTGLGLATVYGIVKQHDGWIEVSSEIGKGTVFKIFFPRSAEAVEMPGKSKDETIPRGDETILLVEDETPLRQLVQFLLERQGYHVLEADSGLAAIKIWEQQKDNIDLLLTDLVMPNGMNGHELSSQLLAENPKLKVIFTSGYSAETVGKDFVLRDGLNFLQKPYHPDKLARTVRDCLDGK
jgi:two-component system cell cycle sensor histidine kinase/response regulator CckA